MKRVYHKDDYKNMAVDLLCIANEPRVLASIASVSSLTAVLKLIEVAALLTKVSNTIDPDPIIAEDSDFKETVYSKH